VIPETDLRGDQDHEERPTPAGAPESPFADATLLEDAHGRPDRRSPPLPASASRLSRSRSQLVTISAPRLLLHRPASLAAGCQRLHIATSRYPPRCPAPRLAALHLAVINREWPAAQARRHVPRSRCPARRPSRRLRCCSFDVHGIGHCGRDQEGAMFGASLRVGSVARKPCSMQSMPAFACASRVRTASASGRSAGPSPVEEPCLERPAWTTTPAECSWHRRAHRRRLRARDDPSEPRAQPTTPLVTQLQPEPDCRSARVGWKPAAAQGGVFGATSVSDAAFLFWHLLMRYLTSRAP
jgi:hypothetical protein